LPELGSVQSIAKVNKQLVMQMPIKQNQDREVVARMFQVGSEVDLTLQEAANFMDMSMKHQFVI